MIGSFFMPLLVFLAASFLYVMFMREKMKNDLQREKIALAKTKNRLVPRILDVRDECTRLERECEVLRMLIRNAEQSRIAAENHAAQALNRDHEIELFY